MDSIAKLENYKQHVSNIFSLRSETDLLEISYLASRICRKSKAETKQNFYVSLNV